MPGFVFMYFTDKFWLRSGSRSKKFWIAVELQYVPGFLSQCGAFLKGKLWNKCHNSDDEGNIQSWDFSFEINPDSVNQAYSKVVKFLEVTLYLRVIPKGVAQFKTSFL